jgi:SEC-C motif
MSKLWNYEDYVNHLSHQNKIVRCWAFAAIENHYPNRYTDEVSILIGDEVEHLARAAPRYLAMHEAFQHAPAILDSFKKDHGNIPSNCAIALGNMFYEPAIDVMLEYFSSVKSEEAFWGILEYLGKIDNENRMDYIYSDAIRSMNALDESADEVILAAIKNKELDDWQSFSILEYLPYSEAYDLALQRWEDENYDMDSYELFAGCLRGIGDPRGIEKLQHVYANENDATYIGDDLECLSIIHNVNIPEMPDIFGKRKEQEERQKARQKELNELAANYKKNKSRGTLEEGGKVVPFKRDSPKVGRNDPCPCGSGKKYKKCCLNKNS